MMQTNTQAAQASPFRRVTGQDSISLLLVIVVTLVALLLGLLLRSSVQFQTNTYTDTSSRVVINYPEGWRLDDKGAASGALSVSNSQEGGVPTTFELHWVAIDTNAPVTSSLTLVANDLAANRAQTLAAFKVFDTTAGQTIKGLPGEKVRYVYVDTPPAALRETSPTVVLGDDYLVLKGSNVYIFSLHAPQAEHDDMLPAFERFVDSATLP